VSCSNDYVQLSHVCVCVCQTVSLSVIVWLLRNRFLYQVHSYVTLLPPIDTPASTTTDSVVRSDVSTLDSSTDASLLSSCFFVAGSDTLSRQMSTLSDADASAGEVRRTSLDAMSSKSLVHSYNATYDICGRESYGGS